MRAIAASQLASASKPSGSDMKSAKEQKAIFEASASGIAFAITPWASAGISASRPRYGPMCSSPVIATSLTGKLSQYSGGWPVCSAKTRASAACSSGAQIARPVQYSPTSAGRLCPSALMYSSSPWPQYCVGQTAKRASGCEARRRVHTSPTTAICASTSDPKALRSGPC